VSARIAVVDEQNRFLRWTDRAEVHAQRLPHRSVHIAVHDHAGRLLVQRRHRDKLTNPGAWDLSCAGHVEEPDHAGAPPDDDLDAVYARVAARELEEELGVRAPLVLVGRFTPEPGVHYEHIHLFHAVHDGPFTLQAEEVEDARFVDAGELLALLAADTVTSSLAWFARHGWLDRRRG
jgi:isopentenyldiphosphate isomerase